MMSESEKTSRPAPGASDIYGLVLTVGKAIVGLAASIGGLAVVVGSVGFLIHYQRDVLLGIDPGLRDNREYFATGGLFFTNTGWVVLSPGNWRDITSWPHSYLIYFTIGCFGLMAISICADAFTKSAAASFVRTKGPLLSGLSLLYVLVQCIIAGGLPIQARNVTQQTITTAEHPVIGLFHESAWHKLASYHASLSAITAIAFFTLFIWQVQLLRHSRNKDHSGQPQTNAKVAIITVGWFLLVANFLQLPFTYGAFATIFEFPRVRDCVIDKEGDKLKVDDTKARQTDIHKQNDATANNDYSADVSGVLRHSLHTGNLFLLQVNDKDYIFYHSDCQTLPYDKAHGAWLISYVKRDAVKSIVLEGSYDIFRRRREWLESTQLSGRLPRQ